MNLLLYHAVDDLTLDVPYFFTHALHFSILNRTVVFELFSAFADNNENFDATTEEFDLRYFKKRKREQSVQVNFTGDAID